VEIKREQLKLEHERLELERRCCHTPNRFGTVNMEDNINIE